MWYIIDALPGAQLVYGLKEGVTNEMFAKAIEENKVEEMLNYVPVHKGDVFFIPAGMVHAIGAGILLAEIQQNSNTTYRVSDYGRLGADGKPRELHVKKAVDVTVTGVPTIPYGKVGEVKSFCYGTERQLAECEYFKTLKLDLDGEKEINAEDGFVSLLVLSGEITVKYDGGEVKAQKGGSILIPQGIKVLMSGRSEVICSTEN
jgi:mannose-6-phosphate isomerase